jgi:S-adenosylmethionine synthetase
MNILFSDKQQVDIDTLPTEMVERKGLGHPDTLADMVAESFSSQYSQYCLDRFGVVANHYVDKITLVWSQAKVDFWKWEIITPINAYLFGKATTRVGQEEIDIRDIFIWSIKKVFDEVFPGTEILNHLKYHIDVHDGRGLDHPNGYYTPSSVEELKLANDTSRCNDTVICTGYAPYSATERLCIEIENFLNWRSFKEEYKEVWTDIKVLCTRVTNKVDVTLCIPFIAGLTPNRPTYEAKLKEIQTIVQDTVCRAYPLFDIDLHINTKDESWKYAYLTVFWSALDKWDQWAVWRWNRYNGLISVNREMNTEAYAGKNPLNAGWKLYNVIAHTISAKIFQELGIKTVTNISARNGGIIDDPNFVIIKANEDLEPHRIILEEIISSVFKNIDWITKNIIYSDALQEHVHRSLMI